MSAPAYDSCRVCAAAARHVFTQPLLGRAVDYFECARCGYLQTQTPYWLEAAYSHAINDVDTGIMRRNRTNVGRVVMTLAACGRLHGRVIDHAGGFGILVRMLRDAGVDARWRDKFCENKLARGFEHDGQGYDLLTAFEVLEHLVNPLIELRAMLEDAPMVLASTELIPGAQTPRQDWWYLGPEHGQHIGFFRIATMRWMAQELGCHYQSYGSSVHLFSRPPLPFLWRPSMRLRLLWPAVAIFRLTPRTQNDFDALRHRSR